jgi:cysteine-rich repeat protein
MNPASTPSFAKRSYKTYAAVLGAVLAVLAACSGGTATAKAPSCDLAGTPIAVGKDAFCNCPDGTSGTWVCQDNLQFGECGPCTPTATCPNPKGGPAIVENESTVCPCPGSNLVGTRYCGSDGKFGECSGCDAEMDAGSGTTDAGSTFPPGCGNGKVDPGEPCDDGNNAPGDTCSPTCTVLPNGPNAGTCQVPTSIDLWPGIDLTVAGVSTRPYGKTHARDVQCLPGTRNGLSSKDRVFKVTSHKDGTLYIATRKADFDHVLDVRSICADQKSAFTCSDKGSGNAAESVVVTVKNNVPIYLWIDGQVNTEGTLDLNFRLP